MISVIICSRKENNKLVDNIKETIGFEHEIIIVDNSENKYSIFQAYNLGISKSKGNYFCFIHDDIIIHQFNWGTILKKIFDSDSKIGLIGVAGSKIKTKMPSGWWNCPSEFKEINILQHVGINKIEKWNFGFKNSNLSEVVVIDGVFMVLRKSSNLKFNEKLKGFHNYDLNISFECKKNNLKIVITNEILLEHLSNGSINNSWIESTLIIHNLYKKSLPLSLNFESEKEIIFNQEFLNGKNIIKKSIDSNIKKGIFNLWFNLFILKPTSRFHFQLLKRIIKKLI